MMMLEAGAISPQKMNDIVRTVIHARMMCFDGHVADALALYDHIAQSIASDWALAEPRAVTAVLTPWRAHP